MPPIQTVVFKLERLQELMNAKLLTPTEVAAQAGMSASTVSRALCGRPVGRISATSISKVLQIPLVDLIHTEPPVSAGETPQPAGR